MALGRALAQAREERDLTVDELVALADVSRRNYLYIEGGMIEPKVKTLTRILAALDVPPEQVMQPMIEALKIEEA
ncbi:helix-turn-helix transcriptional regulator [Amycolatopsis sp.]|uniref:helix-turn-helix domain-containing protein n=1 Tax=Amycolatopsis sp. TaxID=37632 RepID=UPI002C107AAB|nr:helix-turn-helix transcriptional regulator [Amycolatopsis sp.]HVV12096.1 helix-turn-helix transcriptional regulator [Amycolatopsis sp.]